MSERIWHSEQYTGERLDPARCPDDPLILFDLWFAAALQIRIPKLNAMTLATVDAGGRPSARIVLLKEVDQRGFVFFTHYDSRKGRELDGQPHAALVFFWDLLDRQIRIEGSVERIDAAASDAYFAARPRPSRIGALASPQSRPLLSREELDDRVAAVEASLGAGEPVRPASWGGYRVVPDAIEFWQGQPSRLHDRVLYRLTDDTWTRVRLAP